MVMAHTIKTLGLAEDAIVEGDLHHRLPHQVPTPTPYLHVKFASNMGTLLPPTSTGMINTIIVILTKWLLIRIHQTMLQIISGFMTSAPLII